ncbi:MAG TPA: hypothetical protein VIM11_14095, partial [Tepidisphaeraceae bacterium]
ALEARWYEKALNRARLSKSLCPITRRRPQLTLRPVHPKSRVSSRKAPTPGYSGTPRHPGFSERCNSRLAGPPRYCFHLSPRRRISAESPTII